jgi:hypothetical protein
MTLRVLFRALLGSVAVLVICCCIVVLFGTWFLLPRWQDHSLVQDLGFRSGITFACIVLCRGCVRVAKKCFTRQNFIGAMKFDK